MLSLMALKDREQSLRAELTTLQADNLRLEARTRQFAGPGYDTAAVAARAREQLGFSVGDGGPVLLASVR